jgi:hypothetical protein
MRLFEDGDLETINGWYAAHGEPPVARETLPTTGFIVEGVAVGFFYRTDSALALVHHVVTNPAAGLRERYRAVHEIIRACQELAKALGLRGLLTWSSAGSIVRAARRAGGREVGQVTLVVQEV